jgi:hypothetical protein
LEFDNGNSPASSIITAWMDIGQGFGSCLPEQIRSRQTQEPRMLRTYFTFWYVHSDIVVLLKGNFSSLLIFLFFFSHTGHMMLMLPTWPAGEPVDHFTSFGHWAISSTLTTNHLLAIVALSNTLMSMNSAAFTDGKIIRQFPPRFKSLY